MSVKAVLISTVVIALAGCAGQAPSYNPGFADPDGNHGASHSSAAGWRLCYDTGKTKEWDLPPCQNARPAAVPVATYHETKTVTTTTATQQKLLPIIHSYTVYFDLNKSTIRASEQAKIAEISHDIDQYHPAQVTVAGHTDTTGKAGYNVALSGRRADAVSKALTKAGVANQVIDKKALGEKDLAVPTANGVKNQENRRVVIDFRK